jgi:hypothetical protein
LTFWVKADPAVVFAFGEVLGFLSCSLATFATLADVVSFGFFAAMFPPPNGRNKYDYSQLC